MNESVPEEDKLSLSMFLELCPRNIVLPFPHLADCCRSLSDSYNIALHGEIRSPSDSSDKSLNGEMRYSSDCVPELYSMEIDEPSEFRSQPEDSNSSSKSSSTAERSRLYMPPNLCNNYVETVQPQLSVACLESYESLREKCYDLKIKFNDYLETTLPEIQVQCLESFKNLKEKCEELKIKFNDYSLYDTAYEVDMVFAHKWIEDEIYYFVKWKNYTTDSNTWEPECHLTGCRETIQYYHAMRSSKVKINKKILHYFVRDIITRKPYDTLSLTKTCALCFDSSEKYVNSLHLTISQMKQKVKEILTFPYAKISKISEQLFNIMQFAQARKRVLINLKEWELEINKKNQTAYILVENDVDLETAPAAFQFIHDYINTTVEIPEEPVAFCNCEDCYENKKMCCPKDSEGHFAYSKHRRLILQPGYPIYECNKLCECSDDCVNRVVQHGQKVKVCIFRTSNGCGWGLKTLDNIDKGQFVLEYLGEIITSEAAEARGYIYDYIGRSYLFDLDYGVDNCCYTVDAGHVGNAAHFINHSCDPNLHVFAVWINQPDPNLPRLAFFAKRKIKRGEELTFDYKMVQKNRFGPQSPMEENERIFCRCNSKNCRKFLF